MEIRDITDTVQVSSGSVGRCVACDELLPANGVSAQINHYLEHGYVLLHIGTEGGSSADTGDSNFVTVAILGQ